MLLEVASKIKPIEINCVKITTKTANIFKKSPEWSQCSFTLFFMIFNDVFNLRRLWKVTRNMFPSFHALLFVSFNSLCFYVLLFFVKERKNVCYFIFSQLINKHTNDIWTLNSASINHYRSMKMFYAKWNIINFSLSLSLLFSINKFEKGKRERKYRKLEA